MKLSLEQIKAARAMKGWGQAELAERSGVSLVTIGNIESGASQGSKQTLQSIAAAFQKAGIEFIENGVQLTSNSISVLNGKDAAIELLEDVFHSLSDADPSNKELLLFGADESRSSSNVISKMKKLRDSGVRFRRLITNSSNLLSSPLDEYRELPTSLETSDVILIFADKVAFILEKKPHYRVLLVKNDQISTDYRRIFQYFWESGPAPHRSRDEV